MSAPLKLKSERVGKVKLAGESPFLSVLVDTGVYHLDQPYDYSLPAHLEVQVGDWVSVPFNGRNCSGLVIARRKSSVILKVQPINRVIKGPKISKNHLKLYEAIAARWAVPIFDVLRFVTRFRSERSIEGAGSFKGKQKRLFLQLPPDRNEIEFVRELSEKLSKEGRTLVVVPEAKIAESLSGGNFEVTPRGGILSPEFYTNLIILREDSAHHYELKSPGFNSRDVALLRSEILKENLLFVGYAPSLELARLIEMGFIAMNRKPARTSVLAKPSVNTELIPSQLIKEVKAILSQGSLLVLAPSKGYGLAISCASCRNLALCGCGGKLTKLSRNSDPICSICRKPSLEWRCAFCGKEKIYLLGRGIERIAEEFGKSFPNIKIFFTTAERPLSHPLPKKSLLLATPGTMLEPNHTKSLSGVLFLDGLNLGTDLRSEERFLSLLMRYTAHVKGRALVVERPEHPAINALIKWDPMRYLSRQILQYSETELPPSTRHVLMVAEEKEAAKIFNGFLEAMRRERLPLGIRIHLLENGVISLFFPIKQAVLTLAFLREFQRRRSISGKSLVKMRIDPYQIG